MVWHMSRGNSVVTTVTEDSFRCKLLRKFATNSTVALVPIRFLCSRSQTPNRNVKKAYNWTDARCTGVGILSSTLDLSPFTGVTDALCNGKCVNKLINK